jgi:hypothetical protein
MLQHSTMPSRIMTTAMTQIGRIGINSINSGSTGSSTSLSAIPNLKSLITTSASASASASSVAVSTCATRGVTRTTATAAVNLLSKILALSGGGAATVAADASTAVDLTRIGMRLSAMSSYALISSLLLGSGLYLFAITPLKVEDLKLKTDNNNVTSSSGYFSNETIHKIERKAIAVFTVLIALCCATSLHTVIVFNVMNLYANTALGQGMDDAFISFWFAPAMQSLRKTAFYTFAIAIQSFKLSFALSVFLKSDGKHRWIATGTFVFIMLISGFAFWHMVGLASMHIFHN